MFGDMLKVEEVGGDGNIKELAALARLSEVVVGEISAPLDCFCFGRPERRINMNVKKHST